MNRLLICCLLIVLVGSCTIEKRLYRKGFHIERRSSHGTSRQHDDHSTSIPSSENPAIDRVVSTTETVVLPTDSTEEIRYKTSSESDQSVPETAIRSERIVVMEQSVPLNDDSTVVKTNQDEQLKRDMKDHRSINVALAVIFTVAAVALVVFLISSWLTADFLAIIPALLVLLLLVILGFIVLIVRDSSRPDRVQKSKQKKADYKKREETGELTAEEEEKKQRAKRNGLIFLSIFLGIFGTLLVVINGQ